MPTAALLAEPGRVAQNSDVVAAGVTLALFDVPDVLDQFASQPTLLLAASTSTPAWKACGVEIDAGHQRLSVRSPRRKTVLGRALTTLAPGEPYLVNTDGSVEVELIDPNQWLVSCDDEALANGGNLAVLGSELIQFGDAAPISAGRFRLGRLLRGRGGTEWAAGSHIAGDIFALIERDALRPIQIPSWVSGSSVTASMQMARYRPPPMFRLSPTGNPCVRARRSASAQWWRPTAP